MGQLSGSVVNEHEHRLYWKFRDSPQTAYYRGPGSCSYGAPVRHIQEPGFELRAGPASPLKARCRFSN